MNDPSSAASARSVEGEVRPQPLYVIREEDLRAIAGDELSLVEICRLLWLEKWWVVGITALAAVLSIVYALNATKWYRAEVLLAPAEERSMQGMAGPLGGLANLVGISVGGGNTAEPLAMLQSREFTREFIEDRKLLPVLYAERFDAATGRWKSDGDEPPDIRDAVKYFDRNVRSISVDRETKLVTLAIEWTDPQLAADWANELVRRVNDRMRQRALTESRANVGYLEDKLSKATVITLQQSIGRLLETEIQKLLLAEGNAEFSFRVVDPAQVPKQRARPRRGLIVVVATVAGGMLAVLFVLIRNAAGGAPRSGFPGTNPIPTRRTSTT